MSCSSTAEIIQKDFQYDKIFNDIHRVEFVFHLENLKNSGKTAKLIKKLIYNDMNFDEYIVHRENIFNDIFKYNFKWNFGDEYEEPYIFRSSLMQNFNIEFFDDSFVIIKYEEYYYYAGAAHGVFWFDYFIIDIAQKERLEFEDLINPVPDNILLENIKNKNIIDTIYRENIWPPDAINIKQGGVFELIWNIYSITPYAVGPVFIEIPADINEQYLTEKGKLIKAQLLKL